jgi:hypothetical protein
MANAVEIWFRSGQFYPEGLALLAEHGGDVSGLVYSGTAPTMPQRAELSKRLEPMRNLSPKILATKAKQTARETAPSPTLPTDVEPEEITSLRERAKLLHKQEAATHAEMRLSDDTKRRYTLAYEIMVTIRPALDEIYGHLRTYEQTGKLPINENVRDDRTGEASMRRLLNLRSALSKNKSALAKGGMSDVRQRRLKLLIEMKQAEIDSLEKILS